MIHRLSENITHLFISENLASTEDEDIFTYTLEIILSTLCSVIAGLAISLVFDRLLEGAVFMAVFALLRNFSGGYHAKTHFNCIFTFSCILTFVMAILIFLPPRSYMLISVFVSVLAGILVFINAPVGHKNKPIGDERALKAKSRAITVVLLMAVAIC